MRLDVGESILDVKVCIQRIDVWKRDDVLIALTLEETGVLAMLKEVYDGDQDVEVPSFKAQDVRKIAEEAKLDVGLMHNFIREGIVTDIRGGSD